MAESIEKTFHVCSFESRRALEMETLLTKFGCWATVAPSMRELPIGQNPDALTFAERLLDGEFDVLIFMTGVGARALLSAVETRFAVEDVLDEFRKRTIIVRGPKPAAVLKEWSVPIHFRVPEPNTWRELVELVDREPIDVSGKKVVVQEYGKPNTQLEDELVKRGALITSVPVYRWALPEETAPLEQAIRSLAEGDFDAVMFTSAQQVEHVFRVAERMGFLESCRAGLERTPIMSIGPTCSEAIICHQLAVALEPTHPKMGHLVRETAAWLRDNK